MGLAGKKYGPFAFSLLAMLVPAAMQFGLFAFYARTLGVQQYGLYIALMSWSPLCFELVGWGAGELLLKQTAQDRRGFARARGHLRAAMLLTLPLAVLVFSVLTVFAVGTKVDWPIIGLVGFCEFAGLRLMVNAEQMAMGLERFVTANWLRMVLVVPRIAGVAVAYFAVGYTRFDELALAGSLGLLIGGLAVAALMHAKLPRTSGLRLSTLGLRQGTWFTGNQMVRAGQHNIDRIALTTLVDPSTLAIYSAAQRFVQLGLLPLQSVLRMTYRGFFQAGQAGIRASLRYGLSVLPMAVGASAATALCLLAGAFLLPLLIGPDFAQSATYLLYMAPILVLFAISSTFSDTLSGAGFLPLRLVLTATGVALQALMFWLFHDGIQILVASYAGIALSCLLTVGATMILVARERRFSRMSAAAT